MCIFQLEHYSEKIKILKIPVFTSYQAKYIIQSSAASFMEVAITQTGYTWTIGEESGSFRPWVVSPGRFALSRFALVLWVGRFALSRWV